MSESTVIRSPQEFLTEWKKLADAKVAAPPLTGPQIEAKIAELSLALESTTLTPEMRKHIEAAREDLVRQQYLQVHGFIPDENGERPVDENEIAKTVTASVLESLTPKSLSTGLQAELKPAEPAIIEADAVTISAPEDVASSQQAVTIEPDIVGLLRAALRANLMHVVVKVLTILLQEK